METSTLNSLINTAITAAGTLGGWEALRYLFNRKSNVRISRAQASEAELATMRLTMDFLQSEIKRQEEDYARQNTELRRLNTEVIDLIRRIGKLDLLLMTTRCDAINCTSRIVNKTNNRDDETTD